MATSPDAAGRSDPLWRLQQRQRLLLSIASRGSSEAAALVIPGIVVWLQWCESGAWPVPLLLWWLAMALMACAFVGMRRRLRGDLGAAAGAALRPERLRHWERWLGRMAVLNAGSWALAIPLSQGGGHELRLFIYLMLCGVVASAPPSWRRAQRCSGASSGCCMAPCCWRCSGTSRNVACICCRC